MYLHLLLLLTNLYKNLGIIMSEIHRNIESIFNKYALSYEQKYMSVTKYESGLLFFIDQLEEGKDSILEIGCGPGNISKYIKSQRNSINLLGIDISNTMIKLAQANNPNDEFIVMSAVDIASLNKKYNGIICGFCLPYLSKKECTQLLFDASRLLTDEGIIYLSLNLGDFVNSGYQQSKHLDDQLFMYFYDEQFIIKSMESNGFTILYREVLEFKQEHSIYNQEMIIVAKS